DCRRLLVRGITYNRCIRLGTIVDVAARGLPVGIRGIVKERVIGNGSAGQVVHEVPGGGRIVDPTRVPEDQGNPDRDVLAGQQAQVANRGSFYRFLVAEVSTILLVLRIIGVENGSAIVRLEEGKDLVLGVVVSDGDGPIQGEDVLATEHDVVRVVFRDID